MEKKATKKVVKEKSVVQEKVVEKTTDKEDIKAGQVYKLGSDTLYLLSEIKQDYKYKTSPMLCQIVELTKYENNYVKSKEVVHEVNELKQMVKIGLLTKQGTIQDLF
jgi:5-methylthioribose kinase